MGRAENMNIKKGSYADKILTAICFSGDFPYKSLYLLDDNLQMLQRNARRLRDYGYISILGSGQTRTLRMLQKGIDFMMTLRPELTEYFLFVSENNTARGGKTGETALVRRHRLAESMVIIQRAGIYFLKEQKPFMDIDALNTGVVKTPLIDKSYYYNSRELKNVKPSAKYKYAFTRFLGAIFSPANAYLVYNTNKGLIKWNNQGENKAKMLVDNLYNVFFDVKGYKEVDSAIIFAKDMEVLLKILNSKRGKKDKQGFQYLSFDNTFPNTHFITLDKQGINQMFMLTEKGFEDIILNALFKHNNNTYSGGDYYDKATNTLKIEFFSGNIGKLKRFNNLKDLRSNLNYEVLCFDFQEQVLRDYLDKKIKITAIPEAKFYDLYYY